MAMEIAEGEYVAFIDGDDWFDLNALEISYGEAASKNTDITFFQMINYDDKTSRIYENDWFNLNNLMKALKIAFFHRMKPKAHCLTYLSECAKKYIRTLF